MKVVRVILLIITVFATGLAAVIQMPVDYSRNQQVIDATTETYYIPDDFPTIQRAISSPRVKHGDTIIVKPGTYMENIDFTGKAITVKSSQGPEVTVIDGNQAGSVVICQGGEEPDSVLNGFTITNGSGTLYPFGEYSGGGMYNFSSSPTVANCTFLGNTADYGGGMWNWYSIPKVSNCTFSGNWGDWVGGGMSNWHSSPRVSSCTFTENEAGTGGGMCNDYYSSPTVTNCTFSNNKAQTGGGMQNVVHSNPKVTNSSYSGNTGGGMSNIECSPVVSNCIFSGNTSYNGGGICNWKSRNPTIINCIFIGNEANGLLTAACGGGMWNKESNPALTNCTFSENTAGYGGGMYNENSDPTVTNCILWDDTSDEIYNDSSSSPAVSYSCVQGGWPGIGNIDADPLFVNATNADFHLTDPSPCHNTGDNSAVTELTDFEGDPRIAYGTVDMGADEFYTHLYWTGDATPGGNVEVKFVGLPGTTPVGLCIGTGVLDPPLKSMWGDWYLAFPIIGPVDMGSITSPEGVLIIPATIPGSPPAPYSIPMQALIGAELTNLLCMQIQ